MKIQVVDDLRCPKCGAEEMHPDGDKVLIRAFKVDNYSQCLVCAGYYDPKTLQVNPLSYENCPAAFDPKKGWFR